MKRTVSLEEISDGKLYGLNDMVKAGCNDCKGCSACCRGMGKSIVLDPLDVYRLTAGLGVAMQELLADKLELNVVDGIILPNLKMTGAEECCAFLNEEGRCSIHEYRPGICRLFPLGRYYENGSFQYFLQNRECPYPNPTKVKVSKWIDTPNLARNQEYINSWHYFLLEMAEWLAGSEDEELAKKVNLFLLQLFFLKPYDTEADFYEQFYQRMEQARAVIEGE